MLLSTIFILLQRIKTNAIRFGCSDYFNKQGFKNELVFLEN